MNKIGVGIIGCGNISAAYLRLAPQFKALEMRAVADLNMDAARARAEEFGVRAETVDDLLAADDIELILNLTIPDAHFAVSKAILEAGKHAYSEKPLVLSLEEGEELRALADSKGLRVGSAPDTWMGGAHQAARAAIDEGKVGTVTAGTAHVMSHGMEHWHPNPDFFFLPGGGPMLDLGPYYITNLVQLLGPVDKLAALTSMAADTRTITSEPRKGETVPVKTPTNIHALLHFKSGATITVSTSWDVWAHRHGNMELYGTEGTLFVPDPNFFGGKVEYAGRDGQISEMHQPEHPFGIANEGERANYRTAGLADMAQAIVEDRPHRCSLELALHVVEVMTGVLKSGESGEFVKMTTTCERPKAVTPDEASKLLG
ncbi:Gfo/Idh/MocA family protein [Qingshengfaniella alkalisoli]|uniref:Gfo/Idh/MocA family oxidoreductase n=1 Tax=Qingshengfaniella alkalisoli TaxID=2599296 RepID=A0A5B8I8J6_9RHOB|nr:Gfo/Idh/MocA family oxidoreductase [Qingshengfaniella alkalisoli]QDY69016.1 Gfo/Idh/MocA family oxidoreductase [Qingshengfaniella alkalisoli]